MSRELDGGREPRKDPASRLISDQEQAGKLSDPLRFGPEREPKVDTPKQRRPDWKKASARKVREAPAPAEPERRVEAAPQGDGHQPASEVGAVPENAGRPDPLEGRADLFPPDRAAESVPPAEHGEPPDDTREAPAPRGPERASLREGPAARLGFEDEDAAPGSQPGKAAPKGPRPSGRGPGPSQGAGGADPMGQSVPKDGGGKFRTESNSEQVNRAKFRMEKREAKLDKARDKLAKQKPPKPKGPVRKIAGAAGWTAHGFVHSKIYENEHENVGIEGAHRSELAAEAGGRKLYRFARRKIREHPAKAVRRAQSRFTKATANYHLHRAAQEQPELAMNAWKRFLYKRRLKQQYCKRAKEAAKYGAAAARKTAVTTEKLAARTVGFIKRHPVGVLLALACLLIVFLFQSCTSALAPLGSGAGGGIGATTYAAKDEDILAAEAAYCDMEAELQAYLDNYTATHSYDEYHFDLDEIGHDPYVLISILSALHEGEWTLADVEGTLADLFDRQYILTEKVVVETRYRTETSTDPETGETTTTQVPYDYYICYVTLENFNLSHLPIYMMGEEQMARYALYMASLGNRPDLFPGSGYVDKYTQPVDRYEVPTEYLSDEQFAALLTEAEKYVGYPYVWGGSSPATSFDCSGYLSWVLNQCGWNVGRLGATGLYNYCTPTSNPKPGDLVFFVGTYDTTGISHCGLYLGDGMMLHAGDPIGYANLNTSYWQSHLYAYGRLP